MRRIRKEFRFSRTTSIAFQEKAMPPILQVDRTEWEAFLEKLKEFERKYNLLLNKVDTLQSKLQNEEKNDGGSPGALKQELHVPPQPQFAAERNNFLGALDTKLKALNKSNSPVPKRPYVIQNNAYCSSCGYRIIQPSSVCERCGCDFNALVCSCGRELTGSQRFCDRCGRIL